MADFVAVLKRTIDNLGETTPEVRAKVYEKARATVGAKLAALNPPPPPAVAERQRNALEAAIREVEAGFAPKPAHGAADPLAELDALFSDLAPDKKTAPKPAPAASVTPAPAAAGKPGPAMAAPAPAPPPRHAPPPVAQPRPASPVARQAQPTPPAPPRPAPPPPAEQPETVAVAAAPAVRLDEAPEAEDDVQLELNGSPAARERDPLAYDEPRRRSGALKWLLTAPVALVVFGGAAYGLYLNKDRLMALVNGAGTEVATTTPPPAAKPAKAEQKATPKPEQKQATAPAAKGAAQPAAAPEKPAQPVAPANDPATAKPAEDAPKFTQRLNADGTEVDTGRAGGQATIGEGTSVAAATQPPPAAETPKPAEPAAQEPIVSPPATPQPAETTGQAGEQAVPVGQKAIFYEERTSTAQGSAEPGSIVWSLVQESPGGDLPPEPAIRAEATIPAKDLKLRMTIRRNGDTTLPASHIVELIFLTPESFPGGPIDSVLRMTMKETEESAGNPLLGMPAKIADGFFLIALNDGAQETEANKTLMGRRSWIDVPIVYKSGRRALITMEKGVPGEKVFEEAMKAWQSASSG